MKSIPEIETLNNHFHQWRDQIKNICMRKTQLVKTGWQGGSVRNLPFVMAGKEIFNPTRLKLQKIIM